MAHLVFMQMARDVAVHMQTAVYRDGEEASRLRVRLKTFSERCA